VRLAVILAMACSGGGRVRTPEPAPVAPAPLPPLDPSDPASVAAHLVLPESEAARREAYAADIVRAGQTVRLFAAAHGWSDHVPQRPYEAVEIHANAEALWQRLLVVAEPAQVDRPSSLPSAALEDGVLVALTEAAYRAQAPEHAAPADAWRRLVAHELVHRLHVAVLAAEGRGEDAMGPRWFFEGLAVVGSGQDLDVHAGLAYPSVADALAGVAEGDVATAYPRFAAAVRLLARKVPVPELVARAGDADFEAWLRQLD
jgi:hypothetical protein